MFANLHLHDGSQVPAYLFKKERAGGQYQSQRERNGGRAHRGEWVQSRDVKRRRGKRVVLCQDRARCGYAARRRHALRVPKVDIWIMQRDRSSKIRGVSLSSR